MSLAMPDSITVANLPPGYDAYLGYADGQWPTEAALKAAFPGKPRIILTVTGATLEADGCDIETGDLNEISGAAWVQRKLAADPGSRPVTYASVSLMQNVIYELRLRGIDRGQVRLLSAHYQWKGPGGTSAHICGPSSCAWPGVPAMDGTQWTDTFPGQGGRLIDMSMLGDSFFGPQLTWTEKLVQQLPELAEGAAGGAVRTVQGLCVARGSEIAVDGVFGPATRYAVQSSQAHAGIAADGIVGPQTWPVLLGIA